MPTLRYLLLALAVAFTVLGIAETAAAQQIVFDPNVGIKHSTDRGNRRTDELTLSDCENDTITFNMRVQGGNTDMVVQTWVGENCTDEENRRAGARCRQVGGNTRADATLMTISASVKDLVGGSCAALGDQDDVLAVYFLLFDRPSRTLDVRHNVVWEATFDLAGPPFPTEVKASSGEGSLIITFKAPETTDLAEYRVYCDPKPPSKSNGAAGEAGAAGAAGAADGSGSGTPEGSGHADGGAAGADGGTAGQAGSEPVGGESGAGGDGGTGTSTAGTGGSAGSADQVPASDPDCGVSAVLKPGQVPNAAYLCGSSASPLAQTMTTNSNLENGVRYRVGVAGVDAQGNVGKLSGLACGTPQQLEDFYEAYRRAGGTAGGGFCSIHARPSFAGAIALLGACAVLFWRRRNVS